MVMKGDVDRETNGGRGNCERKRKEIEKGRSRQWGKFVCEKFAI